MVERFGFFGRDRMRMSDRVSDVLDWIGERLSDTGSGLAEFAFNLAWAIVIVVAATTVVRYGRRWARTKLERGRTNNNLPALITNALTIVAYIVVGLLVLRALGASSGSLVTSIGLITAAVSLALQDVLKNFVAGLYLLAEQPFMPGDRIRVVGEEGRVERIDIRTTSIRNDRSEQVLVPNFKIFTEVVGNRTRYRVSNITILISGIAETAERAETMAQEAIAELPGLSPGQSRIDLVKIAPETIDLQVSLGYTADLAFRRAALIALQARFPNTTLTVI
jgi:small-conductance mechanosensitive channel